MYTIIRRLFSRYPRVQYIGKHGIYYARGR